MEHSDVHMSPAHDASGSRRQSQSQSPVKSSSPTKADTSPVQSARPLPPALAAAPQAVERRYPPNTVSNPSFGLPSMLRIGDRVLERPTHLPRDLDERYATEGVYILVPQSGGGEVTYVVSGPCDRCLSLRQFCDRRQPECGRCAKSGVTCALGAPQALEFRRPAVVQPEARKHARKASTSVEHAHAHAHPPAHAHAHPQAPESPAVSGIKRPRVSTGPARALPARAPPLRPEDVPSTAQDERYASRTRDNVAKDAMQPHGFCPVWAGRRQALYAACEYFRNPTQTVGASVQLGSSGIGRGVLLEGNPTIKAFWGTRDETGTIVAAIGPTRRRYQRQEGGVPPAAEAPSNDFSIGSEPKDPEALTARLSDDISELGSSTILRGTAGDEAPEPAVLEGLFLAQRARIPVAVAVCEDYGGIPFSLPQPFVVLGWFWVTDSWTVPAGGRDMVSWLFQFEWCSKPTDDLEKPWWSTSAGNGTSYAEATEGAPWPVRGPGISGSVTLRGGQRPEQKFTNAGLQELVSDQETVLVCSRCNTMSEAVYEDIAPCLNERCDYFFKDVRQATHAPQCDPTVCPGQVRERTRLLPRQLGLDIVGTAANARFSDVERHDAQAAKWRAWVCRGCRCANERRDWFGFVCEGCALVDKPEAKVYTAAALAPPNRMVLGAAPRQAAGIASWSGHFDQREAQHPAGLAVHYKLAAGGAPSVTQILPNGEARAQYDAALELLQQQTGDVPLARQFLSATSARVPELALCAFYTAAWGTQQPPYVAHLPTSQARPWTETPEQLLKLFDTVSRRQDRPVSVTVVAVPGRLQRHSVPTIPVPAQARWDITALGSDATVKIKASAALGEVALQHGERIEVDAGALALDLDIKMDGFGFVLISQNDLSPPTPTPIPQWHVGSLPLDKTAPLRTSSTGRSGTTFASAMDAPSAPDAFMTTHPPFRGIEVRAIPEVRPIDVPDPGPLLDSDEEDEPRPARGPGSRGGRVLGARSRARPRASTGTMSAASSPVPSVRGRGRARASRGRTSRGRGRASAAAEQVGDEDVEMEDEQVEQEEAEVDAE